MVEQQRLPLTFLITMLKVTDEHLEQFSPPSWISGVAYRAEISLKEEVISDMVREGISTG